MPDLRRAVLLAPLLLLAPAPGAEALTLSLSISSVSTLQLGGGATDPLTGSLDVECPTVSCIENGTVVWDILEMDLQSPSISLLGSGPATFITHPSAPVGFLTARVLTLEDSGLLTIPPEKPATLFYGFDVALLGTTGTIQHYRYWSLRSVGPASDWTGGFSPTTLTLDLLLEEVFTDLDVTGITGTTIGQTAAIHLVVPEPAFALLLIAGVALLAIRRA